MPNQDASPWSRLALLSRADLEHELIELGAPDAVKEFLRKHGTDTVSKETSERTQRWLKWCQDQTNKVRVNETLVSRDLLPTKTSMALYDIKVFGKRRVPDDALYNANPELRRRVARGNTVLVVNDFETGNVTHDCAIFALKKFTGGMGDEDEEQNASKANVWMEYFLKPHTEAARVVCTRKENGEAAHLAARWVKDRFVLVAGSKNVHLVVRGSQDLTRYNDGRYRVAREVAAAAVSLVDLMEERRARALLSFLHYTKVTAVFEVLQPSYMHVVDLSYLKESELNFITWTLPYCEDDEREGKTTSLSAMAPDVALDLATALGLKSIHYDVIDASEAEPRMDAIRRGFGYEGEVLYFVDGEGNTIGLLKKKTAWYIILRAIREKISHTLAVRRKDPSAGLDPLKTKVEKRLDEIQKWIGFPNEYLQEWKKLGVSFLDYMVQHAATEDDAAVRGKFPVHWKNFLKASGRSDEIEWKE